jgi:hypothetical protein
VAVREVERVGEATAEGSEVAARATVKVEAVRLVGRVGIDGSDCGGQGAACGLRRRLCRNATII